MSSISKEFIFERVQFVKCSKHAFQRARVLSVSRFQEKEKRGDNNNDNIKMITFADHEK